MRTNITWYTKDSPPKWSTELNHRDGLFWFTISTNQFDLSLFRKSLKEIQQCLLDLKETIDSALEKEVEEEEDA